MIKTAIISVAFLLNLLFSGICQDKNAGYPISNQLSAPAGNTVSVTDFGVNPNSFKMPVPVSIKQLKPVVINSMLL